MTEPAPEFSRRLRLDTVGDAGRREELSANEAERAALARRFDLLDLALLEADFRVRRDAAGYRVEGRVRGSARQRCVTTDEPVAAEIDEQVDLLYVREADARLDEEVELSAGDCDVLPLEGEWIDLGEAAAQSFGLALDPYPRSCAAPDPTVGRYLVSEEEAAAREAADKAAASPFAALKRDPGH